MARFIENDKNISFDAIRSKIDEIDDKILELLCDRKTLVQHVKTLKTMCDASIEDKTREQAILKRLKAQNSTIDDQVIEELWQILFTYFSSNPESLTASFIAI